MWPKRSASSFSSGGGAPLAESFSALCSSQKRFGAARCRSSGTRCPSDRYAIGKPAADRERQHAAERRGLVELRDDQRLGIRGLEHLQRLGEAAAIGAGRQREHGAHAMTFDLAAS